MKLSKAWRELNRDQKRAWSGWAKSNRVLLPDGSWRRVSGHKAMSLVLANRERAGEAANPGTVPAATAWLNGALSVRDAGPFTTNAGFIGFRAEQNIADGTKWFVWATGPMGDSEPEALRRLRFITVLAPGAMNFDDLTASLGAAYMTVHGTWDGPGEEGAWPVDQFVWFRLHQYAGGQLGPGVVLRGQITVEL